MSAKVFVDTSIFEYLLTEDLNDGQRLDGVLTIVNVFKHPEFFTDY